MGELGETDVKDENKDESGVDRRTYYRVDSKRKLALAIFCREYHLKHNKNPKIKDIRTQFP